MQEGIFLIKVQNRTNRILSGQVTFCR